MRWLNQAVALTVITLRTLPQRLGTSLVIVIGIAGVVGVLVAVLAMSEGFRHTLASTGRYDRVIMLRAPDPTPRCRAAWGATRPHSSRSYPASPVMPGEVLWRRLS